MRRDLDLRKVRAALKDFGLEGYDPDSYFLSRPRARCSQVGVPLPAITAAQAST